MAVPRSCVIDLTPARRPRVAVIEPWGGAIDAGWTRWVLEQHAFEYTRIRPADLQDRAGFAARFDAIVIPEVPSLQLLRGQQGTQTRPEHRGGLEDRGVATLKHFVRTGGTIITLGNAAEFVIDHLDVPAVIASRGDDADDGAGARHAAARGAGARPSGQRGPSDAGAT